MSQLDNPFNKSNLNRSVSVFRFLLLGFPLTIVIVSIIFHRPILIRYWNWITQDAAEFDSQADVLVYMDVKCRTADLAAQKVADGKAKAIYSFAYDDITCEPEYRAAVEKYGISDRAYWGGVSSTTFGGIQTFHEHMEQKNLPHDKVTFTIIQYAMRRTRLSFKQVLGEGVKLNSYKAANFYKNSENPEWWKNQIVRNTMVVATQKTAGYYIYYKFLGRREAINIPEEDILIRLD